MAAIKKLKDAGVTKDNIQIYYWDDSERIRNTRDLFIEAFGLSDEVPKTHPGAGTTTKIDNNDGTYSHQSRIVALKETFEILAQTVDLMMTVAKGSVKHTIIL